MEARPLSPAPAEAPPVPARLQRRAIACLLLGAACIALAPIFVRVSEVPPTTTAFYRLAFASRSCS